MRITMGHPDYVYRPLSQEQRDNMRAAARRRLGIPDGYRRVFGALVDEAHAGGSPARADAPPLPEKTLMPMPYADPAFDDLIVRRVQSTMAMAAPRSRPRSTTACTSSSSSSRSPMRPRLMLSRPRR
jgi:hypothetical protein